MTPSTAVTTRTEPSAAELELMRAQEDAAAGDVVQTPILKVCQALTREVQDDKADPGDFFNTLTEESLGNKVEFILAFYNKGRSAADRKNNRYYVAFGDTIPESWKDLVGEQFVGTRFDEHPDAEEVYKRRVNDPDGDLKEAGWGKGPLISTTYNYTGFVIVPPAEDDEDGEAELQPVRFSLQRSNKKAADRINTLRRTLLRGRPAYDRVFELETEKKQFNSGPSYVVKVNLGRDTDEVERAEALALGQATVAGNVASNDAAGTEDTVAPATPEGAVAV